MAPAQLFGFALMAFAGGVACLIVLIHRAVRHTWRLKGTVGAICDLTLVASITAVFALALLRATWISLRAYALLGFLAGAWAYYVAFGKVTSRVLFKLTSVLRAFLLRLKPH
ncbi:MAG: spore cortex biosynthesis protein YabQ [Bacillota bacterium]